VGAEKREPMRNVMAGKKGADAWPQESRLNL